jgi:PAS domain S-box-containing protein
MLIQCLVILSVIIQLLTAFLALRLLKITGRQLFWTFFAIAMVLQASRRIITFIGLINTDILHSQVAVTEWLGLAISVLMLAGVAGIGSFINDGQRNIIERNMAEESLAKSEEKYRNMFENNPQPMWIYDMETLKFLEINGAAIHQYGYTREEFLSMTLKDIRPREDLEALLSEIANTGKNYNPASEWRHLKKNGEVIYVEIISQHVEFNNRTARHVMVTDISARKHAEEEIIKLNLDLEKRIIERTSQLEATNRELESFSYSVSHDLRAPLRHISGFANTLVNEYYEQLPEKARQYLSTITDSVERMGILIDDILSFSKTLRVELTKSQLKMNQVVEDALAQIIPSVADRKIEWEILSMPEVSCDYNLMRLVWINLIDNAVKYTRTREKAFIKIGFEEREKEILFHIRDNGVGFDMQYSQKLFGVFQRLHSGTQFEGTGIGLANAQKIILRHGGKIWAEAETEKGAIFYFTIPKEREENQ